MQSFTSVVVCHHQERSILACLGTIWKEGLLLKQIGHMMKSLIKVVANSRREVCSLMVSNRIGTCKTSKQKELGCHWLHHALAMNSTIQQATSARLEVMSSILEGMFMNMAVGLMSALLDIHSLPSESKRHVQ